MTSTKQTKKKVGKTKRKGEIEEVGETIKYAIPPSEQQAVTYVKKLKKHIQYKKGRFVRDDDGRIHIIVEGKKILLDSDQNNTGMAGLMVDACRVSTLSLSARAAIQRLQVHAVSESSGIRLRRFSALSEDGKRLYIPLSGNNLLVISAEDIKTTSNADNQDSFWVEHPYDDPLKYESKSAIGLEDFERLCVVTQATKPPALRWLVAMHEGFFPFLRDSCPARLLFVHEGPSQQGKTSGAQRFTLLHGLGEVKGDYSVAALGNQKDIGLLVLDNREQANFDQALIDFCLFLSTGAQRGRSSVDGLVRSSGTRPVAVITSIEGVFRAELQARCLEVPYSVTAPNIGRADIEREIRSDRHMIVSAMMPVLQRYFQIVGERRPTQNPLPQFEEHFTALCNLLRAYGDVAKKEKGWAEAIIAEWCLILDNRETNDNELEPALLDVLRRAASSFDENVETLTPFSYKGLSGTLYITQAEPLLIALQKSNLLRDSLPKAANGLTRRLGSSQFRSMQFLNEHSEPRVRELDRTKTKRFIGFFVPDDG